MTSHMTLFSASWVANLIKLFLFNFAHKLLRLLVLAGHDVADTQVGQHYGRHLQDRVEVLLHDGLVEPGGFLNNVKIISVVQGLDYG